MKRNWDVIRDVLTEVEALDRAEFQVIQYGPPSESVTPEKDVHGILLWQSGFITGANASGLAGDAVLAQSLTWEGHDLLETIRSKAVWERIKSTAEDKGIELTFDAVKALGKVALASLIGA